MPIKTIERTHSPYPFEAYAHIVSPLSAEDGGGFFFSCPDLPGCIADGDTIDKAIANGRDAFQTWISVCIDRGDVVPAPHYQPEPLPEVSGKFVQRLPKTLHARLTARAKTEGVSLNTLVVSLLSESLARRDVV